MQQVDVEGKPRDNPQEAASPQPKAKSKTGAAQWKLIGRPFSPTLS